MDHLLGERTTQPPAMNELSRAREFLVGLVSSCRCVRMNTSGEFRMELSGKFLNDFQLPLLTTANTLSGE